MNDRIEIAGLWLETVIGVYDWERSLRQRLLLDLTLYTDTRPAAQTDDLARTLDYKAITDRLIAHAEGSSHQLVETLAEELATLVLRDFGVSRVQLRLSKPGALPRAQNVSVCIERSASA